MQTNVKRMALVALFAAIIAVCSWISIPTAVPFTMQTFAVFGAALLLGGRDGTLAVLTYLLLGAVGLPVFSGFKGGVGALLGATGGYLLGFLLLTLTVWLAERFHDQRLTVPAIVVGLLLCYAFGTAWFMVVYARDSGAIGLGAALGWCVLPFLLPDAVKLALAIVLSRRVPERLTRR